MDLLLLSDKVVAFLLNLNLFSLMITLILALMSILTWYLLFSKLLELVTNRWRSRRVVKLFRQPTSLLPLLTYLHRYSKRDPFSQVALQTISGSVHYQEHQSQNTLSNSHSDFLARQAQQSIVQESVKLQNGLIILAMIGSVSPFIGLLGTVLGIYQALITIGYQGNASLTTVAVPVGEALIMTAFGLVVAIPAVLSYNFFLRSNQVFLKDLQSFAHHLQIYLNTGAQITTEKTAARYQTLCDVSANKNH